MVSGTTIEPLEPVDLCGLCGNWVTPQLVTGFARMDDQVWLEWHCPCGMAGASKTTWTKYRPLLERWMECKRTGEPFIPLDAEAMGRLLQGWRIELDVVNFVEDMMLHWAYQEKTNPKSIPKEL